MVQISQALQDGAWSGMTEFRIQGSAKSPPSRAGLAFGYLAGPNDQTFIDGFSIHFTAGKGTCGNEQEILSFKFTEGELDTAQLVVCSLSPTNDM